MNDEYDKRSEIDNRYDNNIMIYLIMNIDR